MNIKEIQKEIKLIDRQMDLIKYPEYLDFMCSDCKAKKGKPCTEGFFNRRMDDFHFDRELQFKEARAEANSVYESLKSRRADLLRQRDEYNRIKYEEAARIEEEKIDALVLEVITEESEKHREIHIRVDNNRFRIVQSKNIFGLPMHKNIDTKYLDTIGKNSNIDVILI